ncbi:hypothetical protein KNP414_06842 [Paenibacillus mucilaginosus KNP414]|uniref:Uncharacterized protein n=1 Tax=Paenibacillus mucilaginosus (strain KNP414) TaxID=1036673 RepID=F8FEP4_PAEMK|nr:hypothetical protein KNP414_06842 [Paenibacillus mucilaginosus KNP414]
MPAVVLEAINLLDNKCLILDRKMNIMTKVAYYISKLRDTASNAINNDYVGEL